MQGSGPRHGDRIHASAGKSRWQIRPLERCPLKILFFGSLREQLGTGELELTLPDHVQTVSDLVSTLKQRGEQWQQGLGQGQFLCAINQVMT
ncbi:MAG: hypothetical protein EP323_01495, partial [Gammaproteobacteria bacterium]